MSRTVNSESGRVKLTRCEAPSLTPTLERSRRVLRYFRSDQVACRNPDPGPMPAAAKKDLGQRAAKSLDKIEGSVRKGRVQQVKEDSILRKTEDGNSSKRSRWRQGEVVGGRGIPQVHMPQKHKAAAFPRTPPSLLRYTAAGNCSPRQLNQVGHSSSGILEFASLGTMTTTRSSPGRGRWCQSLCIWR